MAYPDYSIVVIDVTVNGVTTTLSNSYFDSKVAKKIYNDAVTLGHRAFLYEKPTPSDFQRNDSKEIINSVSEEAALLAAGPISSFETGNPLVDTLINSDVEFLNAQYEIISYVGRGLKSGTELIGTQIHKVYQTALGMTYSVFEDIQFTASGTVLVEITVDNHTYKVKATGSINVDYETINNCPEEGLIINASADSPIYVTIENIGQTEVGAYSINTVADGICGEYQETVTTYIPDGTEIGSYGTITYFSDGIGGYTLNDSDIGNPPLPCDAEGIENTGSRTASEDIYYEFESEKIKIGSTYTKYVSDGFCGEESVQVFTWLPAGTPIGTVVSNFDLDGLTPNGCLVTVITCDGTGGIVSDVTDNCDTPPTEEELHNELCAENPEDPSCQCPDEGILVNPEYTIENIAFGDTGGNFVGAGMTTTQMETDAECGARAIEGSETTEWFLSEGDVLNEPSEEEMDNGTMLYVYTSNGQYSSYAMASRRQAGYGGVATQSARTVWPNSDTYPLTNSQGIALDSDEIEKYIKGDYRPSPLDSSQFLYAGFSPRRLWGVTEISVDALPNFWTIDDKNYVSNSESQSTKAKYPTNYPFDNGLSEILVSKKAGISLLKIPFITGVIWFGRQVAWPALKPAHGVGLKWYYESDLITEGVLGRDSRWTLPTEAKAIRQGGGVGGTDYSSYTNKICCPLFKTNFFPMISWTGTQTPQQQSNDMVVFKESGTKTTNGVTKQLYNGHSAKILCDGLGGITWNVNLDIKTNGTW